MSDELSGYPDPAEDGMIVWLRKLTWREPELAAQFNAIADEMERLIRGHNEYNAANRILAEQVDTVIAVCGQALQERSGFAAVAGRKELAREILAVLDNEPTHV